MQILLLFLALLQSVHYAGAVKHWMFKRCDQNPFCDRNREYAATPPSELVYHVDVASLDLTDPEHIRGTVFKELTDTEVEVASAAPQNRVHLPFTLEVTTDNMVHLLIDEEGRKLDLQDKSLEEKLNPGRYDPAEEVLDETQENARRPQTKPKVHATDTQLQVQFGDGYSNAVVLEFAPVKLLVYHNGELQVTLNKHNFLNYEHLRRKREGERNANWEDRFDGFTDERVKGPESVAVDTSFENYSHIYGIPEHADALSLRDTRGKEPYRLFNVDIFEYETESPMAMYGSIPFLLGNRPGHSAGVFWLNAADTYVDIAKLDDEQRAHWISETGKFDVYIIVGSTPSDVLATYGLLTGTSMLPQEFALGYHQCRWNYWSQDEVLKVASEMDKYEMPFDVLWLDLEWTEDRKYFEWNHKSFSDAVGMLKKLDETKRKLVKLVDPHVKVQNSYRPYELLKDQSALILDKQGQSPFQAHCWPGQSVWVDGLHPDAEPAWTKLHAIEEDGGATNLHIWNDMSEPSVFSGSETTAYKNTLHYGGWQHRDVHNFYGHTVTNLTYKAMLDRYEGKQRPFILTRSFFPGSQRISATWTGDNQAEWSYLRAATPMILTMGVSGFPFTGADIGGFFRNPSDELFTRWMQAGVFYPFFRNHAHIDSKYREPYLLEGGFRDTARNALELRYALLPTIYTAFWDASQTLQPIMKPLFWEAPANEALYGIDDEFFLGSSLLAKPIVDEGAKSVSVVLPDAEYYYNYFTGERHSGSSIEVKDVSIDTIPLYVKGGSVVFRKDRPRRSAEQMKGDPYTLLVAVGRDGTAKGHLYVDDGITFDYSENDDFLVTDISYTSGNIRGTVRHPAKGSFKDTPIERIIVYGAQASSAKVEGGDELDVESTEYGFTVRNPRVLVGDNWSVSLS